MKMISVGAGLGIGVKGYRVIFAFETPDAFSKFVDFRPVIRGDRISGDRLGEKVVWQMLREYAAELGIPGLAPHDLRRTCAKLCRAAGGELEQIPNVARACFCSNHRAVLGDEAGAPSSPNPHTIDGVRAVSMRLPYVRDSLCLPKT